MLAMAASWTDPPKEQLMGNSFSWWIAQPTTFEQLERVPYIHILFIQVLSIIITSVLLELWLETFQVGMWGGICQLLVQTTGDLNEQCNNRKMLLRGVTCTCYDHQAALWPSHGCLLALLISFFHVFLLLQANPGVVTTLDNRMHGFQTGDKVTFKEIVGMTALNGTEHTIKGNWRYWKKYMKNMVELHKVTLAKTILQGTREVKCKSGYTQHTPD